MPILQHKPPCEQSSMPIMQQTQPHQQGSSLTKSSTSFEQYVWVLGNRQVQSSCRRLFRSTVVVSPHELKGTVGHEVASLSRPNPDSCVREATRCTTQISSGSLCGSAVVIPPRGCGRFSSRRRRQAVSQMPHLRECWGLTDEALYRVGVTQQITEHNTVSPAQALTSVRVGQILCPVFV